MLMSSSGSYHGAQKSTPQKVFQREFQFIDGQDKTARKRSRTHVTKEFYRERRWNQIHSHKSEERRRSNINSPPKPDFVVSITKLGFARNKNDTRHLDSDTDSSQYYLSDQVSVPRNGTGNRRSLYSPLGAGRIDPFQTYPIQATMDVHHLVDHYHFVIPSLLHKQWGRHITHPMPIMDLFEVYRQDPASFLGMLHHAAHHLGKMRGRNVETQQTIDYKYRTLKILNERLATTSGPYDDHTIVAIGLLANAERIWGDKKVARMHWGATKRMILDRGGFPAFQNNHLVHTKLIWSFIALSGAWPVGNPAYIDEFAETVADEHAAKTSRHRSAFSRSCDEFANFFVARKAQALRALPTSEADREHHVRFPLRSTSFRPGTRMFKVLAAVDVSYSSPEWRRAVDNCRLTCLIYLNAVLLEYGDFSPQTEKFFELFSGFVEDDDLDCDLSAEHLLWALIRGIEPHATHERIWKVSRMIGVVKRANQKTWWEVEEALRMFLVMPDDGTKLMVRIASWDIERFRKEILSFPDFENDYNARQLITPVVVEGQEQANSKAGDLDFLPETRDVQWFPRLQAAAESGVEPHKLYPEVRACKGGHHETQGSIPMPFRQKHLAVVHSPAHNCGDGCQICKLRPDNY